MADAPAAPSAAAVADSPPCDPSTASPSAPSDAPPPADAQASPAAGTLSFQENMFDQFEFLWEQKTESSWRLMEQVTAVLRSRAMLERQYGNSMMTIPDEVQLDSSSSTIHEAVEAVMVNFRNRGEQCLELAESIDNDVILTLEEVMKQHKEAARRMHNDAMRLINYVKDTRSAHSKMAKQYHNACSEAELVGQECMASLAMKPLDRNRLGARAVYLSKQARQTHKEYMANIDAANKAQAIFDQHMPLILAALQDMELKRANCVRDCLTKLAVYETSWLRNLQYDIDATVKAAEVSDADKDLQEFIRKNKAEEQPKKHEPFTLKPFWELGKARPSQAIQQHRQNRAENDTQIQAHMNGLQPMVSGFFHPETTPDFVRSWEPGVNQLKSNLTDLRARAGFFQLVQKMVLQAQAPQAPDVPAPPPPSLEDGAAPVKLTSACFEVMVAIFMQALSFCERDNDGWCGKLIMVLVPLIQCDIEGSRQVNLLTKTYMHPLWNKVSFWEEMLLVGIFEMYSAEGMWRRTNQQQDLSLSAAAVTTPFLNKFVWFMGQFGIRGEQARTCIREGLRKNQNILGSAVEQFTRTLVAQIDALEAQALASQPSPAAATPGFAPPQRQLEASQEATGTPTSGAASEVAPGSSGADNSAEVHDRFGDQTVDQGNLEDGEDDDAAAPTDPQSESPGSREPADTLRKLGIDQPSSSDVFE